MSECVRTLFLAESVVDQRLKGEYESVNQLVIERLSD